MILANNNGMYAHIQRHTNNKSSIYLDGTTLSVHCYGLTAQQANRLKIIIRDYIDKNMLMDSYATIKIFY